MTKAQKIVHFVITYIVGIFILVQGVRLAGGEGQGPWQYSLMAALGFLLVGGGILWSTFYTNKWWKWPGRVLFVMNLLSAVIYVSYAIHATR